MNGISKNKCGVLPMYLLGEIEVLFNGIVSIENVDIAVHEVDGSQGRVTLIVSPGEGIAGVLNPVQTT